MRTDGTEGRTLFPSPEFSHWPPFERFAETFAVGTETPDPHPHDREEVVVYVLSGGLWVYDDSRRRTEVPPGSLAVLSTMRERVHDVTPPPGSKSHWLSLVLRLPYGTPEPGIANQTAAAVAEPHARSGVQELRVVGERGPARSALGLEIRDLNFERSADVEVPDTETSATLVYVLAGRARAAGTDLPAGSGLLAEGLPRLTIAGDPATRVLWASIPQRS